MPLTVMQLKQKEQGKFDIFEAILKALTKNNIKLEDGDVVVIQANTFQIHRVE